MMGFISKISLIFLVIILIIFVLIILRYLFKALKEEFQKNRILTLYYQRSTSRLTKGIDNSSGRILLDHNLRFEEQINYLFSKGYQTIAALSIPSKKSLPSKPLLLFLDNGYRSHYLYSCPVIKKYGFTATIFITPDPLSEVFTKIRGLDLPLTPRQIKELHQNNFCIGSHGMTLRPFSKITSEELRSELKNSKKLLKTIINEKIDCFTLPSEHFLDRRIQLMAKEEGYKLIAGNRIGTNTPTCDPLNLRKIVINKDMDLQEFKKLIKPHRIFQKRIFYDLKNLPFIMGDLLNNHRISRPFSFRLFRIKKKCSQNESTFHETIEDKSEK